MSILFLILATSCQREVNDGGNGGTGETPDQVMVQAGIRGVVVDENNQPVQGATVKSGANSTTTDRYGVFRFSNISLSRDNGYVRVEKAGYFNGLRSFVTTAGLIHNVKIRLLPKTIAGSFSASSGGTITLVSGGKAVLPANAVTDANGNAYTGMVNVAMTWIDPTAANLPDIMVGDLRGITTEGQERGLDTYGMLGVELTGAGGQPLKMAAGQTAELNFPIPAALAARAPQTIDLWHFDEGKGRWIQEGTATRNGNQYQARVSHFSFWNCDVPFPLVNLCMKLVNAANNQPLAGVQVRLKMTNGFGSYGYTDSVGNLCGRVPKNEPLLLQVIDQCNTVAYSQPIGPFGADVSLGTVAATLPSGNTLTVTGTLTNCAGAAVTNGTVSIYADFGHSYSIPVTNGSFTFTMIRCSSSTTTFAVKGTDLDTYKESILYNGYGNGSTVSIGNMQACSTGLSEYIEYIIDGVPYMWVDLGYPDQLQTFDSVITGPYPAKTGIQGHFVIAGNAETTHFTFEHNGVPGVYPLVGSIRVTDRAGNLPRWKEIVTPNPTLNITAFGPPGTGYVEGNFNLLMRYPSPNSTRNILCTFKVKRD